MGSSPVTAVPAMKDVLLGVGILTVGIARRLALEFGGVVIRMMHRVMKIILVGVIPILLDEIGGHMSRTAGGLTGMVDREKGECGSLVISGRLRLGTDMLTFDAAAWARLIGA